MKRLFIFVSIMLLAACSGCSNTPTPEQNAQIQAHLDKTLKELSFFKGGEFMFGDTGGLVNKSGLQSTPKLDDNPPIKVSLDSFSLMQYKVTFEDYDIYVLANNLPDYPHNKKNDDLNWMLRKARSSGKNIPVGVNWQQAKDYCLWLGKSTGYAFDLPTEAQWEYAARNGGNANVRFATDNGKMELGRNWPNFKQKKKLIGSGYLYPNGLFPPTPMSLYDMVGNAMEWVDDWYSPTRNPDYLKAAGLAEDDINTIAIHNPKGPNKGTNKTLRGWPNTEDAELSTAYYLWRRYEVPVDRTIKDWMNDNKPKLSPYVTETFRCAVNYPKVITQ